MPTQSSPKSNGSFRATANYPCPQPRTQQTRWQELFEGLYLPRTLLVWVLWASCYIIAYGLQGWIPTLYREVYHLPLQQALNYAIFSPVGSVAGSLSCAFLTGRP